MSRRNRGGMDDYEMERRMEEIEDRRGYADDSVILTFIGIGVGIAVILGALGWVDQQFGWSTVEWFKQLLHLN